MVNNYQRFGWIIRKIRYDAGSVENSRDVSLYLASKSILVEPAAVEHQNQNPVERSIQALFKHVNTILVDQPHLSHTWWGYVLLFHIATINCAPNSRSEGYAPQQLFTKRPINIDQQFRYTFGQPVTTPILERESVPRFTPSRKIAFVVGPINSSNGSTLVYIPSRYMVQGVYARKDVQLFVYAIHLFHSMIIL